MTVSTTLKKTSNSLTDNEKSPVQCAETITVERDNSFVPVC